MTIDLEQPPVQPHHEQRASIVALGELSQLGEESYEDDFETD
jgi:hypothetical protein